MRFSLLTLFALGAASASALAIEERQLVAFQPQAVINKLDAVFDAFNKTLHPTVGSGPLGLGPQVPTNFTAGQLLTDLAIVHTLIAIDALALVTNVAVSPISADVQNLICEAVRVVLRIEKRLATSLDNTFQNNFGTLNSASNLPAVGRALTGDRKATQTVANALINLKVIPQCADFIKDRERDVNRVFAGLLLTMHQKPNTITQAVTNELVSTLNITGGIDGTEFAAISGKPNRRAVELPLEQREEEPRCDGELSG